MVEPFVEIRFRVPRTWRTELQAAADGQAVSLSDLLRLVVRSFLRQRLAPEDQEMLS